MLTEQQHVKHDSDGPHVDLLVVDAALGQAFGRRERERPCGFCVHHQVIAFLDLLGDIEVDETHSFSVFGDQDVTWLYVPVCNVVLVQVLHGLKNLQNDHLEETFTQALPISNLIKNLLAVNILDHLEYLIFELVLEHFNAVHDVRV